MTHRQYLEASRRDYSYEPLLENDLLSNPFELFEKWLNRSIDNGLTDANAMTLATASTQGMPSARIVLLRHFDENGFVFYTNYASHKAKDIEENPQVALAFYWHKLNRQIKIQGNISKVSEHVSDEYFRTRPRDSQLSALASNQSETLESRAALDQQLEALKKQYEKHEIPRPKNWGGYAVKPATFEFWQGRPSRLHDRFRYALQEDGSWKIERLAP
ncbi:MAG: pyridoxamine 5'-phosphate oxidase [Flavobacteriales bacterium]|nr:MAG: pyridoxamine 5'-phosphate oxidase [Flavobacteriales bacterium]